MKLTGFEKLKRAVRMVMAFGFCLTAFTVIAMSAVGHESSKGSLAEEVVQRVATPSHSHRTPQTSKFEQWSSLYRQLESGPRTMSEIHAEIATMAGEGQGVEFNKKNIKRAYKLSAILAHYESNFDDQLNILFVHTLAEGKRPEDTVTLYSRKINGAEEQNIRGELVISKLIEISDKGEPQFTSNSRFNYKFGVEPNTIKRTFDLRAPQGIYKMSLVPENAFDPLALLTSEEAPFDYGLYQYEMPYQGEIYDVKINVRLTDTETLAIEVNIRQQGSLVSQTFVLVYEEL